VNSFLTLMVWPWRNLSTIRGTNALSRTKSRSGEAASRDQELQPLLNNMIEQDHRAIKRRCAWMTGFKSDRTAAITLSGIELAHRIRKRQFSFGPGGQRRNWSLKQFWDRALA